MSGIYGFISKKAETEESINIRLNALLHWHQSYGEDKRENSVVEATALGCCFRKISDLYSSTNTCVCEEGDYIGVFDVLLYNRDEIIEQLHAAYGEPLEDKSDSELLLSIFIQFGKKGLRTVNGDFAGAIYNKVEKKLTLVRDHLGVRTLYYYEDQNVFAFATDYRGLLAMPGADSSINEPYLFANLYGYAVCEKEDTDFARIKAVMQSGWYSLSIKDFKLQKEQYWRLGETKIRFSTEKDYQNEMRRLVEDAIKRRLAVTKNPVGGELSGGLDSTVIDVLIHQEGRECYFDSWSPNTNIVALQDHDEREIIEHTCQKFGLNCHYNSMKNYLNEETILDDLDAYFPPNMSVELIGNCMDYFHSKGAKVAFSGWGGDEGVSHRANPLELWMHQEYQEYFNLMWTRTKNRKLRLLRFAKAVGINLLREKQKRTKPWDAYAANGIVPPTYLNSDFYGRMKDVIQKIPVYFSFDPIRQIEENGGNRFREEATVILGAEHQVQYVFPFLDYRVEDFAVSIPRTLYLKGNRSRSIYREAFQDVMVDELYQYKYKDDPGKGTFFKEYFELYHHIILKHILPKLDRALWKNYLNFDEVENKFECLGQRQKDNAIAEDSLFVINICRCYRIQRLQELNG